MPATARDNSYYARELMALIRRLEHNTNTVAGAVGGGGIQVIIAGGSGSLSVAVCGSHGNAFNTRTTTGANEASNSVDTQYCSNLSVFGEVDRACVLTIQLSADDTNWYNSEYSYEATGAEHVAITLTGVGARYWRVLCDTLGTTLTVTIMGKS